MASFSLVHGAWHGGWCWDAVRAELEARGHVVHTPDLPCDDVTAGVEEYAAAVPPADVVVGHSLGGLTIPYVEAQTHVFLTALRRRDHRLGRRLRARLRRRARPRRARALVLPRSSGRCDRPPVPARAGASGVEAPPAGSLRAGSARGRAARLCRLHARCRDPAGVAAASRPGRPRSRAARARSRALADARMPA